MVYQSKVRRVFFAGGVALRQINYLLPALSPAGAMLASTVATALCFVVCCKQAAATAYTLGMTERN
ncbi:hypothetical protein D3Y59_07495 [Hymenobacter oligotrophus]|uniref:Uncharacterized protein n=1 Tax=Hymenobacter oligotrophus TaxID=2319843 RepID=A0A3B7R0D6_9BACT|nr:hypothetical protein D3Y59_07495 [Hymenobacter oligotrophus]